MNKQMMKDALVLFAITLIAGLLLGGVYAITKDPIAQAQENKKKEAYQTVFMDAIEFAEPEEVQLEDSVEVLTKAGYTKNTIEEVKLAKDESGNTIGYVMVITSAEAYDGELRIALGIRSDGTVNRIAFLTLSETIGLGMEAAQPEFYEQFSNKNEGIFEYTKMGATLDYEIDALSGATITTNAVTNAVNAGICYAQHLGMEGTEAGGGMNE